MNVTTRTRMSRRVLLLKGGIIEEGRIIIMVNVYNQNILGWK
jgi:hypothetical protein